jgi:hypothetical protein
LQTHKATTAVNLLRPQKSLTGQTSGGQLVHQIGGHYVIIFERSGKEKIVVQILGSMRQFFEKTKQLTRVISKKTPLYKKRVVS